MKAFKCDDCGVFQSGESIQTESRYVEPSVRGIPKPQNKLIVEMKLLDSDYDGDPGRHIDLCETCKAIAILRVAVIILRAEEVTFEMVHTGSKKILDIVKSSRRTEIILEEKSEVEPI